MQRSDTNYFKIAKDIDKAYFHSFQNAKKSGVEILVLQSLISKKGIELSKKDQLYCKFLNYLSLLIYRT